MRNLIAPTPFARSRALDLAVCRAFNAGAQWAAVRHFFRVVSRLGDGVFWYCLILVLPLAYGPPALMASLNMALVGLVSLALYKLLKSRTSRPRPFAADRSITAGAPALDAYSFPSGHTLHAAGFSTVCLAWYPGLAWLLVPFTVLVALSRLVLGLHYPSDVAAGALIGFAVANALLLA